MKVVKVSWFFPSLSALFFSLATQSVQVIYVNFVYPRNKYTNLVIPFVRMKYTEKKNHLLSYFIRFNVYLLYIAFIPCHVKPVEQHMNEEKRRQKHTAEWFNNCFTSFGISRIVFLFFECFFFSSFGGFQFKMADIKNVWLFYGYFFFVLCFIKDLFCSVYEEE